MFYDTEIVVITNFVVVASVGIVLTRYTVCLGFFAIALDVIGNLCSVVVALP